MACSEAIAEEAMSGAEALQSAAWSLEGSAATQAAAKNNLRAPVAVARGLDVMGLSFSRERDHHRLGACFGTP